MTATGTRFRAEITVGFLVDLDAIDLEDAEGRARQMASARPGAGTTEIKSVTVRRLSLEEQASRDNLHLWQEMEALRMGTQSQRQRWQCGNLPAAEVAALAREELFRPFWAFRRRAKLSAYAIPHPVDAHGNVTCAAGAPSSTPPVTWETLPDPLALTAPQWSAVTRLLRAVEEVRRHPWLTSCLPTAVQSSIREHRGTCQACGRSVSDVAALVSVDWAGRTLSREYLV